MSTRVPITFKDGIHSKLVAQAKLKERTLSEHVNILLDDMFSGKLIPPQLAQGRGTPTTAHRTDLPLVQSKHKDRKNYEPVEWQGKLWEYGTWGWGAWNCATNLGLADQPRGHYRDENNEIRWWAGVDATQDNYPPTDEEMLTDPILVAQRLAYSDTTSPRLIRITPDNYQYYGSKTGALSEAADALAELEAHDPDQPTCAPKPGDGDFLTQEELEATSIEDALRGLD